MKSNLRNEPNDLIHESSPYLLQHAFNPVKWHAWNQQTLEKAKAENKLLIISIGYSTCHWCHVMEQDSFENEEVARWMNEHFIPVKVDREERPDIDSVYMQAVQLMTGRGGWPLNCIALPDGSPLYGGTFFPRNKWLSVLQQMYDLWKYEPHRCRQYADELLKGIRKTELISFKGYDGNDFSEDIIHEMVSVLKSSFDTINGGYSRAPKFAMPDNLKFLLRYSVHTSDESCLRHVLLSLDKMAMGGIYDHLAGGFARYSTDMHWKVPHFEKMLYDNAQLISVYADAFKLTGNPFYGDVIKQCMAFVKDELTDENGGFYSALDADTQGEEGRYYVWTENEIDEYLTVDAPLFKKAYCINNDGYWEDGKFILMQKDKMEKLAADFQMPVDRLRVLLNECRKKLLQVRKKRPAPGRDDKFILAWNSMMIQACCHAFDTLNDKTYLEMAERAFCFIQKNLKSVNGNLIHSTHPDIITRVKQPSSINALADDYAFYIRACLELFSATLNRTYFNEAFNTFLTANEFFTDPDTGLFFYTATGSEKLIMRRIETEDNVIASPNSVFAECLFILGRLTGSLNMEERCKKMLACVTDFMPRYPSAFANWGSVLMNFVMPHFEIIITGPEADELVKKFRRLYQPFVKVFGSSQFDESIEAFKGRFENSHNRIFVCTGNRCFPPVSDFPAANRLILENLKHDAKSQ